MIKPPTPLKMYKLYNPLLLLLTFTLIFLLTPSNGQNCTSPYTSCTTLPYLSSSLEWLYYPSNHSAAIAYHHAALGPSKWIVWALNPSNRRMIGAQCLVAFPDSAGAIKAYTAPISSYDTSMPQGALSFKVFNLSAEYSNNEMSMYATIELPAGTTSFRHLWQDGDMSGDVPQQHRTSGSNMRAYGTIDFSTGGAVLGTAAGGGAAGGSGWDQKSVHGLLNVVSWGILMPIGTMTARYLKVFKSANPAWFYLHVSCQTMAYIVGVAGWGTGMYLSSDSPGTEQSLHRNIGITLFVFGTLQAFALLLRPKPDHKYRFYWNIYHHSIGYTTIILSIINIFEGFEILDPEQKWKTSYIGVLIFLGANAIVLEAVTWFIVIKKKRRNKYQLGGSIGMNGANGYP